MSSWRSAKSQPDMIRAVTVPTRRPYLTAQASTGPAARSPVTGITPCLMACGSCNAKVLSSKRR